MSVSASPPRFSRPLLSLCLAAVLLLSAAALASPPGRGGDGEGGREGGGGQGGTDGPWGGGGRSGDGGARDGGGQRGGASGGGTSGNGSGGSGSGGNWPGTQGGGGWPSGGGMETARSAREEGGWDSGPDHWPGMGGASANRPVVARVPWFEGRLAGPRGAGRGDRGWPGYYLWDGGLWGEGLWDDGGWYEDVWYGGTWGAGGWGLYVWGRYPWNWGPWGWGPGGWGPWGDRGPYNWGRYGRSQDPRDAPDWIPANDGPWSELPSPFVLPNGSWPDRLWPDPSWLDERWVARVWPDPYDYGAVRVGGGGRRFHHPRSFYTLDVGVMDGRCDRLLIAGPAGFIPGPYGAQPWGRLPFTPAGAVVAADGDDDAFILTGAVDRVGMVAAMDAVDRICLAHTLEEAPVGHVVAWSDPFTRVAYVITPVRTYETAPGAYCRDYSASSTVVDADAHEIRGVACREADGAWRIVP